MQGVVAGTAVHAEHEPEGPGSPRGDAGQGVLDDHAVSGVDAELLGGEELRIGLRLAGQVRGSGDRPIDEVTQSIVTAIQSRTERSTARVR